jgi:hypothetical protein
MKPCYFLLFKKHVAYASTLYRVASTSLFSTNLSSSNRNCIQRTVKFYKYSTTPQLVSVRLIPNELMNPEKRRVGICVGKWFSLSPRFPIPSKPNPLLPPFPNRNSGKQLPPPLCQNGAIA